MSSQINPEKRLSTAYGEFYNKMFDKSLFSGKTELFVTGLVLGFINNKKSQKRPFEDAFTRFSTLHSEKREELASICELIYLTFATGKDENAKWNDFCSIADGGIEILQEQYQKQGSLDISRIYEEIQERSTERLKEILQSISQTSTSQ